MRQSVKSSNDSLIKDDNATLLLLQTNHDSSNYFANYLIHGTHPSSGDVETVADYELLAAIEECEQFVTRWQTAGQFSRRTGYPSEEPIDLYLA